MGGERWVGLRVDEERREEQGEEIEKKYITSKVIKIDMCSVQD